MNEVETRAGYVSSDLAAAVWGVVDGCRIRCEHPNPPPIGT